MFVACTDAEWTSWRTVSDAHRLRRRPTTRRRGVGVSPTLNAAGFVSAAHFEIFRVQNDCQLCQSIDRDSTFLNNMSMQRLVIVFERCVGKTRRVIHCTACWLIKRNKFMRKNESSLK